MPFVRLCGRTVTDVCKIKSCVVTAMVPLESSCEEDHGKTIAGDTTVCVYAGCVIPHGSPKSKDDSSLESASDTRIYVTDDDGILSDDLSA